MILLSKNIALIRATVQVEYKQISAQKTYNIKKNLSVRVFHGYTV